MLHSDLDLALFYYDLAMLEIDLLQRGKVNIVLAHKYADAASALSGRCTPGEEVIAAYIVWGGASHRLSERDLLTR